MFKVTNRNIVCLLLVLKHFTHFTNVSIADFEQVNISWESSSHYRVDIYMPKVN